MDAAAVRNPELVAPLATGSNVKIATNVISVVYAFAARNPDPEVPAPAKSAKTAVNVINAEKSVSARIARNPETDPETSVPANYAPAAASAQSAENAIVTAAVNQTALVKSVRTAIGAAYANLNAVVTHVLAENPTVRARNAQDAMYVLCVANAIAVIKEQAVTE